MSNQTKSTPAVKLFTVALAAAALGLTGCSETASAPNAQQQADSEAQPATTVSVEKTATLTSTLVLSGRVQASPEYAILAPKSGIVSYTDANTGQNPDSVIAAIDGQAITLGHTGKLKTRLVESGTHVTAGVPIATANYAGFGVTIEIPADQLFRVYAEPQTARVNIDSGPSGLSCAIAPLADPQVEDKDSNRVQSVCLLPGDAQVFAGLKARLALQTATAENILTLPITAVSGATGTGEVWLVDPANPDAAPQLTTVTLGITDGVQIEIKSGLQEGDQVLSTPPGLVR